MKVFNVKLEGSMMFCFPIAANDSKEASEIIDKLCGIGEMDEEVNLLFDIIVDFIKERLSRDGEVTCSDLKLRTEMFLENSCIKEKAQKIGFFRMHPVEESRIEEAEKIGDLLEMMGENGVLMEIPETNCCILFDERNVVHLKNKRYLTEEFYVIGRKDGRFCRTSLEEIYKVSIVMSNRKGTLHADGEEIPVFRLS